MLGVGFEMARLWRQRLTSVAIYALAERRQWSLHIIIGFGAEFPMSCPLANRCLTASATEAKHSHRFRGAFELGHQDVLFGQYLCEIR